jgi:hypothetical protein
MWVVTAPISLSRHPLLTGQLVLEPGTRLFYENLDIGTYHEHGGSQSYRRRFLVLEGPSAGERVTTSEWHYRDDDGTWMDPPEPFPPAGLAPEK